ncbi:hypothetical protein ASC74_18515 [Pseudomonas sp. Root329]|uniref:hypothetical protein n=1 Tax=Pseudomonas sp. Root329 TaxID=1736515 RepID=UPI0006F3E854|nr:hypothetical protein [Pseudomonas sp. Root329]KQV21050.1 hypothetical protein ASC74_18515 [Pseudomonas sp. Root329]
MTKKVHLTTSSGSDQNGEWHSSSACGLNEDSNADWDGTGSRDKVTCKRCLTKMAKPRTPSTIGLHKEHPILFSGPMVHAILEGRKTVTRRPLKGHHIPHQIGTEGEELRWMATVQNHPRWGFGAFGATEAECVAELAMYGGCPYGNRGDRLWVRETFAGPLVDEEEMHLVERDGWDAFRKPEHCQYRASGGNAEFYDHSKEETVSRWTPSIHMPRWASRILLEITEIRVERLQDITPSQVTAEGVSTHGEALWGGEWWVDAPDQAIEDARKGFSDLWVSTGGDWDANPWVWVVEFKLLN